jgi:acyl-CoA synthetase (AMP-forming)/AMP-acid ligase II
VGDGRETVGDMARQDEDGYLSIVDRKKDMVISGGVNIYPREIEDVLYNHPNIEDVAVIGVPDEKWGESLKAFIVANNPDELQSEEVLSFCEQNISKIKIPKIIEFIDTIPRNANGKVLKTALKKDA